VTEHVLDSRLQRARGVIGRYPRADERYVIEYDSIDLRTVHMVGVFRPLHVQMLVDDEVTEEAVLRPIIGSMRGLCNRVIERRAV